jgi:hypothetical protein
MLPVNGVPPRSHRPRPWRDASVSGPIALQTDRGGGPSREGRGAIRQVYETSDTGARLIPGLGRSRDLGALRPRPTGRLRAKAGPRGPSRIPVNAWGPFSEAAPGRYTTPSKPCCQARLHCALARSRGARNGGRDSRRQGDRTSLLGGQPFLAGVDRKFRGHCRGSSMSGRVQRRGLKARRWLNYQVIRPEPEVPDSDTLHLRDRTRSGRPTSRRERLEAAVARGLDDRFADNPDDHVETAQQGDLWGSILCAFRNLVA